MPLYLTKALGWLRLFLNAPAYIMLNNGMPPAGVLIRLLPIGMCVTPLLCANVIYLLLPNPIIFFALSIIFLAVSFVIYSFMLSYEDWLNDSYKLKEMGIWFPEFMIINKTIASLWAIFFVIILCISLNFLFLVHLN